ncbi:MAG: hypothetical protein LBT87_05325 [Treponema sp.]|jgi:hypothetical protein|nr:hypothetical protein [Treponema sp.]
MKVRIFFLGILLGAALVLPGLSAQNGSIIGDSTFGLFTDDADSFLDPNDYEGVEFDNAFIYLRGGRNGIGVDNGTSPLWGSGNRADRTVNDNGAGIQGGFATRLRGLYLGFGFDTHLWKGEETITESDGNRADTPANPDDAITFDGAFGVLLGTGNIGAFKLTFDFEQVYLDTNTVDNGSPEETNNSGGSLLIDLGWGKNFEFKGGSLAPEIHIAYQISTYKTETKNPDGFSYVDDALFSSPLEGSRPDGFFDTMSHLIINPGAEYTSPSEAHWFGVGYALDIGIHPATFYKPQGGSDVDWKGYDVVNALAGQYTRGVELTDRFALAFGGGLVLALRSSKVDYTDLDNPGEYVDFSVDPYINIGATYDFAKKPFQLYGALQLDSSAGSDAGFYNVSYAKWSDPKEETYTHTFTPWGLSAGLGLKFSPFENFALDIGLSENLSYYLSDKLEYVWSWDIFNWNDHPFTAALQATIKF